MHDSRLIENLIYTYAERIDAGDLEGVAELFRHGEICSPAHGTTCRGYDEVLALYRGSCRIHAGSGTPLTRHLTSNVIVEIGDSGLDATARSSYTVLQATKLLPLQPIICGRYRDSFNRHDGNWCFARREMFVDLLGDCSQHLLYSTDALG